jgi:2-polyprenyl-3-methyl-5-hydroxy-6-metoxy-1,4-benzoquinol methylase
MTETAEAPYAWDNAWEEARRRLDLLEQSWDPGSQELLRKAGVGPGWRCLEVGGGGGSIVRWLCDAVGPEGSVVTVDLDTRFLDAIDAKNLEVIQANVVTDGLPDGPFDLVHTRAVLMHIPERDALLPELIGRLRPGGTLVLEECDFHSFDCAESEAYREFFRRFGAILQTVVGMESKWARGLPVRLAQLGLHDLRCQAITAIYPGRSVEAQFYRVTLIQAREVLLAHGVSELEFDEVLGWLDDETQWFPGPAMVEVTGRLPG